MLDKYKLYSSILFVTFWVAVCSGIVGHELIKSDILGRLSALLFDAVVVLMGLCFMRKPTDIFVLVSFVCISLISSVLINKEGMMFYFNGMRNYIGILFCLPLLRYFFSRPDYRERFVHSFDRQLYIFLIVQAVCITFQFLKYGANDEGGGSMAMGYSGIVSMLIYAISFYLISKNWDDSKSYGQNLKANIRFIILLYPTMLNETKTSFILLALYFILLYRYSLKSVIKLMVAVPVLIALFIGVFYIYLNATDQTFDDLTNASFYEDYLVGEDPEMLIDLALAVQDEDLETDNLWVVDIPRFTKLFLLSDLLQHAQGGMAFGAGLAQFKGGTMLDQTQFAKNQKWGLQGSRPYLFFIMVELGVIGLLWFLISLILQFSFTKNSNWLGLRNKLYLLAMIFIIMFYNDSLSFAPMCLVFYYIVLRNSLKVDTITEDTPKLSYNYV